MPYSLPIWMRPTPRATATASSRKFMSTMSREPMMRSCARDSMTSRCDVFGRGAASAARARDSARCCAAIRLSRLNRLLTWSGGWGAGRAPGTGTAGAANAWAPGAAPANATEGATEAR